MSTTVPASFIQLYDAEVKAAYQREGSFLRNAVRQRMQVGAERIYFPKLGKGHATSKARHADVVPMNLEHTRVFADMSDYYAPEYIDDLDQAKVNWSLRADYANASAWALGRQTDDLILTAANATSNVLSAATLDAGGGGVLTQAVISGVSQAMTENDVPLDRRRWAIITPETLAELQAIEGVTSSDFANEKILVSGDRPAFWMGFNWMVHTGISEIDPTAKGFFWHQPSMGHGVCRDITTSVDWVPEKVAWLVNSWMSMGSTIIDEDGVFKLTE